MAKTVDLGSNTRAVAQGFRAGGGRKSPYVYAGVLDANDNLLAEFETSIKGSQELGDVLRSEAEFAVGERNEGDGK